MQILKHKMQHHENSTSTIFKKSCFVKKFWLYMHGHWWHNGIWWWQRTTTAWTEKISIGMHFHLHEDQQENRVPHTDIFSRNIPIGQDKTIYKNESVAKLPKFQTQIYTPIKCGYILPTACVRDDRSLRRQWSPKHSCISNCQTPKTPTIVNTPTTLNSLFQM